MKISFDITKTLPRVVRFAPRRFRVLVPAHRDMLGHIHFRTVSEHITRAQAIKALASMEVA